MSHGKKLGLFFGNNAFSIVESQNDAVVKLIRVPYSVDSSIDVASPLTPGEDTQFIATLKENLKKNNISITDVHVALPSKDIVIRSFVIPFLKPSEIKGVVEFEIKKYIPFNLKDLAHSFHAVPFEEEKIKRMRVHFVAIRREILDRYKSLLKQAGLNVVFSEPASLCLARALIIKKAIKADQKVALVQTDFNDPRILVIERGVVQFVRDFQLQAPTLNTVPLDAEMLKKKLFNEIKISLDFYMRQFKSEKIEEVVTLAFDQNQDMSVDLQREIEMRVRKIDPYSIVRFSGPMDVGLISSFGAVLDPGLKTINFDLSGTVPVVKASSLSKMIPPEYILPIKMGAGCFGAVASVMFLMSFSVSQVQKEYKSLFEEQKSFDGMSLADIKKKAADETKKLALYKQFFNKTETAYLLTRIPQILPKGVWLTDFSVRYGGKSVDSGANQPLKNDAVEVVLSGYAYDEHPNQQFKIVYELVNLIKSDEKLKKYFRSVVLNVIQSEQKQDFTVTSFNITCR